MNDQMRLFETNAYGGYRPSKGLANSPSPPYQRKSHASKVGATRIQPKAGGLRAMLLDSLRDTGPHGLTIAEAAVELTRRRGLIVKESTVCGRLSELRDQELVIDSGRTRLGNAGVHVTVWVSTTNRLGTKSNQ